MNNDCPLVSIITPCYNGEKYIARMLDSVIAQTYRPIELILINDGSTDSTADVFHTYEQRFPESGIDARYVYQANAGQAAAINKGLKIFTGDYMMWVDSDDILQPDNVTAKLRYLGSHEDVDFVLSRGVCVHESDLNTPLSILGEDKSTLSRDELFRAYLTEDHVIYGPGTIMVRRNALLKALPDLHIFESRQGQNWQLMLPLVYTCKCGFVDDVLFKYVLHLDSHSHTRRSYAAEQMRCDEFLTLVNNTIDHIPAITSDEMAHWKQVVLNHFTQRKFENACLSNHFADALKLGRLMTPKGSIVQFELLRLKRKIFN